VHRRKSLYLPIDVEREFAHSSRATRRFLPALDSHTRARRGRGLAASVGLHGDV
jgi:hypothetical protein